MLNEITLIGVVAFQVLSYHNGALKPNELTNAKPRPPQIADRRLEHVKLELRTVVDSVEKTDKSQFGPNEDAYIQVLAINSSSEQITLAYWKSFIHYLPQLSRGGESVPYSKAMQKRLADLQEKERRRAEPNSLNRDSAIVVKLPPSKLTEAALISLSDYYDRLEPGVYQLKVKYRERNGAEIVSDPVMFEIVE